MKYQCQICGYIHDEEKEGKSFKELEKCPDCKSDVSNFEIMKKDMTYKTYECEVCHYVYDEEKEGQVLVKLGKCPVCGSPLSKFKAIQKTEYRIYQCRICNYIYDEKTEKIPLKDLKECPDCGSDISNFEPAETNENNWLISFPKQYIRNDESVRHMDTIYKLCDSGKPITAPMATELPMPDWDDILILGNQLNPMPLEEDAEVSATTVIGKNADKPLVIENPVYVSHMSYGALSKESKIALAKGSFKAKTAMCSGEGGILPEVKNAAYKYIFEYVPNQYSVTDENLKTSDAIEIKIGQATKPGMGGLLPGDKVTPEIAKVRGKKAGEDIISPSRFPNINSKKDLKDLVDELRLKSEGRPIGIKIAAGYIENDLEFISYAKPDFITVDGRGGATGASPLLVRDSTSIPTIFALHRARKYLDEHDLDIDLVITGGLRVSSDFAKALAMGADAIAIASASLIAVACQQYRLCDKGQCPVGVATQDKELRSRLKTDIGAKRLTNYLNASLEEIKTFARITGHSDIHDLNVSNLATFNSEISDYTNIKHV